jgi:lipopolysaccharide export system permease protein
MSLVRPLDRYVFLEWTKIFIATSLGLPILISIIDVTDHLQQYLDKNIPPADIAMSYVYYAPQSMFLALPAAVLFATVFSIGTLTRYSEVTAAKASGISFYRLIAPILLGALLASGLDLAIGEVEPITDVKRNDLLGENKAGSGTQRSNFAYAGEYGRVYKALSLDVTAGRIDRLQVERKGLGADYPTLLTTASNATYDRKSHKWTLNQGATHVVRDSGGKPLPNATIEFGQMIDRRLNELAPADLMARPRNPSEMRFNELSRFIVSLERSGGDSNELRVERMLKIAIPLTCLVIALIGAPLATSTQRGGTAWGIGVSLAITVTFLMLVQLTKAIGKANFVSPDIAAWLPNAAFALIGLILLYRVRT